MTGTLTLMNEPMCNYVFKVSGSSNYQFRRKIPQNLIPIYKKSEIKKSLRTSDKREACKLARIEAARLDQEWAELSGGQSIQPINSPASKPLVESEDLYRPVINGEDYRIRANAFTHSAVQHLTGPVREGDVAGLAARILVGLRARRDFASRVGWYEDFLQSTRWELAAREELLANGEGSVEHYDEPLWKSEAFRLACKALLSGDSSIAWANPVLINEGVTPINQSSSDTRKRVSLFELVDKWAAESPRNLKTVDFYNRTATRFFDLVGLVSIYEIKREQVVIFKDKLLGIGQSSINTKKQLVVINTLLNYAKANALIDSNPASGVTIKVERQEKPRVSFDASALNAIFSSPVYKDGYRPKAGSGEAAYWLPLLALFTGARIEELGQLHPTDVLEETYYDQDGLVVTAWVIRIKHSEEFGQGVKNFGSNRRVPIHSELKRLGFLSYASEARKEGRYRIFDKLVADKYGTETAQFSKWFGRYLRTTCNVTDTRMTFHSFRHTFKDLCRAAGIEVGDSLTGHVTGKVGDSYGSDLYPLHPLVNGIQRYQVLGLDLSALKPAA